jgi:hypothetical protein
MAAHVAARSLHLSATCTARKDTAMIRTQHRPMHRQRGLALLAVFITIVALGTRAGRPEPAEAQQLPYARLCTAINYSNYGGLCYWAYARAIADLNTLATRSGNPAEPTWNDIVSSIQTSGTSMAVYELPNFQGRCESFAANAQDNDLRDNWIGNDRISSLKLGEPCPQATQPHVPQDLTVMQVSSTGPSAAYLKAFWKFPTASFPGTWFKVWYRPNASGPWTVPTTAAGVTSIYNIGPVASEARYEFFVQACDSRGCWAGPDSKLSYRPQPVYFQMPPKAPSGVRISWPAGGTVATVQWTDTSTTETRFDVGYRGLGWPNPWIQMTTPANATSASVSGLPGGGRYFIAVRACNGSLCSVWTETYVPPPAP